MSDTPVVDLGNLIQRVRRSADRDARELARRVARAMERPDRRVGAALNPRTRGGHHDANQRAERDADLREFTELQTGSTRNARVIVAHQKLSRYEANGWSHERDKPDDTGNGERDLMRKIMRSGLPLPGERQHRAIVSGCTKKV